MRFDARGFTLLEILIVLSIAGMVMVAISGGVRFGMAALAAQSRLGAHDDDLITLDRTFRTLIGHAMPGSAFVNVRFVGEPHTVRFTTLLAGSLAPPTAGPADVTIGIDRRHRLVLTWQPHAAPLRAGRPPDSLAVLAEGLDHVDISYEAPSPTGTPSWRNDWAVEGLPDLVRLHLVLADRDATRLPDIVAETRLRDRDR